jgi:large repetitive protein
VATLSLTVRPMILGPVTNSATVSAATLDANPDNNTVSLVTTAASPTADLILSVAGSPNPVVTGSNLTYAITVSNAGPATATVFGIRDVIPAGASFVSASSGGVYNGGVVTFDGLSLGSGTQLSVWFIVAPSSVGTLSDTASCSMSVTNVVDPLKGNNSMTVKTTVVAPSLVVVPPVPLLSISPGIGSNVIITWPTQAGPYSVFYWTTNLAAPTSGWTPLSVSPVISGTNYSITVPNDSVEKFIIPGH